VIKSVFHVNINVTDFERSLAFYKLLGFKVVLDLGEGPNHGNDVGLNIANSKARAALLSLSDDPRATRIDLIEWKQPRTAGESYPASVPYGDRSHRAVHQESRRGISKAEGGGR
jgi:glyoxylase I family protein